jgi:hypothetical protein
MAIIGWNKFFPQQFICNLLFQGLLGPFNNNFKGFLRTYSKFKGFSKLTSNSRAFQGSIWTLGFNGHIRKCSHVNAKLFIYDTPPMLNYFDSRKSERHNFNFHIWNIYCLFTKNSKLIFSTLNVPILYISTNTLYTYSSFLHFFPRVIITGRFLVAISRPKSYLILLCITEQNSNVLTGNTWT